MGELGGALGEVFLVLLNEPRYTMSGSSAGEEEPRYTTSGSQTTTSGALHLFLGRFRFSSSEMSSTEGYLILFFGGPGLGEQGGDKVLSE